MLLTVKTAAAVATLTTDSVQTDVFSTRCITLVFGWYKTGTVGWFVDLSVHLKVEVDQEIIILSHNPGVFTETLADRAACSLNGLCFQVLTF